MKQSKPIRKPKEPSVIIQFRVPKKAIEPMLNEHGKPPAALNLQAKTLFLNHLKTGALEKKLIRQAIKTGTRVELYETTLLFLYLIRTDIRAMKESLALLQKDIKNIPPESVADIQARLTALYDAVMTLAQPDGESQ